MSQLPSSPLGIATQRSLSERFHRLATEWKEQSRFLSNSAQMAMLRPYQRIIGMGPMVVPLILEELRREPDHWFWALEAITEQDPVPPEAMGKVRTMAEAWIRWGEQQGIIEHDTPDVVAGGIYGEVVEIMRRRLGDDAVSGREA